jgi:hypothetical protein
VTCGWGGVPTKATTGRGSVPTKALWIKRNGGAWDQGGTGSCVRPAAGGMNERAATAVCGIGAGRAAA